MIECGRFVCQYAMSFTCIMANVLQTNTQDCLTLIINYAKLAFISLFANSMLQNIFFFYFFALYTCLVFLA